MAMTSQHFLSVASWKEAGTLLDFEPVQPRDAVGHSLQGLRIHVRDHRQREVTTGDRTLEADYGGFVLSEARSTRQDARKLALETSYGAEARDVRVGSHAGKSYELGPEPEPDDPDGRLPAVVTWSAGEMFYLIASGELSDATLLSIANSIYT